MAPSTGSLAGPQPAFRTPRWLTITLPMATFEALQVRADAEGRSPLQRRGILISEPEIRLIAEQKKWRGLSPSTGSNPSGHGPPSFGCDRDYGAISQRSVSDQ